MTAGTIDVIPKDHHICDCERAYIAAHVTSPTKVLRINNNKLKELRQLWLRIAGGAA